MGKKHTKKRLPELEDLNPLPADEMRDIVGGNEPEVDDHDFFSSSSVPCGKLPPQN